MNQRRPWGRIMRRREAGLMIHSVSGRARFGAGGLLGRRVACRRRRLGAVAILTCIVSFTAPAAAEWPDRPVRVVVPFAAGGAADVIARLFSESLGAVFSQQFIVENRAGAGGIVGAQTVARADPDGYTLMGAGMSSHVLAPAASKNPGYDPIRDFTHIAFFGGAPSVLLVHPSL